MTFERRYEIAKRRLLTDTSICSANRRLFAEFFEFEERKLKRQNGLSELDESCFKTLVGYVGKLRNVNSWFNNKPWKNLTKDDIAKVYDDLEEGRIKTRAGELFKDRVGYYNKIFKGKPFRLAGKGDFAREVLEYSTVRENPEVRFVTEETFREMVSAVANPAHLLLFWLAWDIGENINTLLNLTKREFTRQQNPQTGEPEYLVNLPKNLLKRTRRARGEHTLYPETVRLLDLILEKRKAEEIVFRFEYRQALKVLHGVVKRANATSLPHNQRVQWKDLRSGMACHLLKSGWTIDEVSARLGHSPGSRVMDKYINFLALDRHQPKARLNTTNLEMVKGELEDASRRERLQGERLERQGMELKALQDQVRILLRSQRIAM